MKRSRQFTTGLVAGLILVLAVAGCGSRATVEESSEVIDMQVASRTEEVLPSGEQSTAITTTVAQVGESEAAVDSEATGDKAEVAVERPEGWNDETHGDAVEPNYDVVFPQDQVNQITITIASADWAAMQANMTELLGEPGTRGGMGGWPGMGGERQAPADATAPDGTGDTGQPGDLQPPADLTAPDTAQDPDQSGAPLGGERQSPAGAPGAAQEQSGDRQPQAGAPPMRGPGGGGRNTDMTPENPSWFSATITFNGETWANVGVRYKGNSSLTSAWQSGSAKLPLKLDFDQFEDEVPAIENQRFYGFKQLSLANGFSDASFMRDAMSYDIAEAAGLVAPETAFYEVLVDYGEGVESLGLYTMVEVIDDTVIESKFGNDDGNVYEADGTAASLAEGVQDQIETSFQKENNEEEADWSDIQALYDVLHSDLRTTNAETWRAELEAVLDVDSFLESLGVNAVIQDWDQYGSMAHNYYLYHNPETDRLVWISWDHNMAMNSGRGGRGGFGRGATSLDQASVGENWPLIRYLLDDEVYAAKYNEYLASTLVDAFDAEELAAKYDAWATLIRPYVEKAGDAAAFDTAASQLKTFATERVAAVEAYLAE